MLVATDGFTDQALLPIGPTRSSGIVDERQSLLNEVRWFFEITEPDRFVCDRITGSESRLEER